MEAIIFIYAKGAKTLAIKETNTVNNNLPEEMVKLTKQYENAESVYAETPTCKLIYHPREKEISMIY